MTAMAEHVDDPARRLSWRLPLAICWLAASASCFAQQHRLIDLGRPQVRRGAAPVIGGPVGGRGAGPAFPVIPAGALAPRTPPPRVQTSTVPAGIAANPPPMPPKGNPASPAGTVAPAGSGAAAGGAMPAGPAVSGAVPPAAVTPPPTAAGSARTAKPAVRSGVRRRGIDKGKDHGRSPANTPASTMVPYQPAGSAVPQPAGGAAPAALSQGAAPGDGGGSGGSTSAK